MKSLFISLLILLTSLQSSYAALSKQDRDELFERVAEMCKDASTITKYIEYEGSLSAGAILKVVGLNAKGKVNQKQWENIASTHGEMIGNPVVCNKEMLKIIIPLFSKSEPNNLNITDLNIDVLNKECRLTAISHVKDIEEYNKNVFEFSFACTKDECSFKRNTNFYEYDKDKKTYVSYYSGSTLHQFNKNDVLIKYKHVPYVKNKEVYTYIKCNNAPCIKLKKDNNNKEATNMAVLYFENMNCARLFSESFQN